ncbi:hypothetical protein C2E25_02070 [Geothermobacter hydrogeniphilus]|uniref:OmpA-like domain-containing protein n=1 Tax=Geothermobacter hydrogeniphilus TaxID=1969733 RepID=A0A2K2HDK7_9BACT|nr:OmpA family protein [Geothermobacter hydrogeniphilus]PNU21364.1 hypothetical protein C2E25_02070 [Geothermobacter hydrogeniphilus]
MLRSWILIGCCLGLLVPSVGFGAVNLAGFQVHFGLNSARVTPRDRAVIARLAGELKSHPRIRIAFAGHTDDTGPRSLNIRLSHDRAAAVRDLLVNEYGIAKGRIGIAWLDSSRPLAANGSKAGRARNRRVDIAFVSTEAFAGGGAPRPAASARSGESRQRAVRLQPVAVKPAPRRAVSQTVLKRVPLRYQPDGTTPEGGTEAIADLAAALKKNPARKLKIQGVSRGTRADLKLARRRVDAVRSRLLYIFKVPARQIEVSWFGAAEEAAGDAAVGVLLQLLGAR